MSNEVKVALAQTRHGRQAAAFLAHASATVREAAAAGARLVAFPETVLPGYPGWIDVCSGAALWEHPPLKQVFRRFFEASVTVPGEEVDALRDLARQQEVTLVVGVSERVADGAGTRTLYNTLLTIGPDGRLLNHHRKLMPTFSERLLWGTGDGGGLAAVATPAGRVGGLICWEHWMPLPRHVLHAGGEQVHVAAWPHGAERHQLASRHYAFEGRCFVLAAAQVLHRDDLPADFELAGDLDGGEEGGSLVDDEGYLLAGGSAVIGPDGEYLVQPVRRRDELLLAELDLDRVLEEKLSLDVGGHYGRPDLFELTVRRQRLAPYRDEAD